MAYLYPKLDIHVSDDPQHLIKTPLVPHQTTGSIAIPIPVKKGGRSKFLPSKHTISLSEINTELMQKLAEPILKLLEEAYKYK